VTSIRKRVTKKGEARFLLRYRAPDGSERTRQFTTKREAERFANIVGADLLRREWVDPRAGKITLAEYGASWLVERPHLRVRTRETYECQLRLHILPTLGDVELRKLTPLLVRKWHAGLLAKGLSANTAAKCYRMLSAMLTTAVGDELIIKNPCVLKGASIERCAERPVATVEQVWDLADAIAEHLRCIVLVAGFAGLREGELLGLERRHVNVLHRTITVEQQEQQLAHGELVITPPKTAAGRRVITLPGFLVDELERHLARFGEPTPTGRVFRGLQGGPLRRHVLRKEFQRAKRATDLPERFTFHDLRHTANTLTAAAGASTRELMARMGHSSPEAALRYQHATEQRDAALAELLGDFMARPAERNQNAFYEIR
jgi:integrase